MSSRATNPLALFMVSSLISLAVILVLIYFGAWYVFQRSVVDLAERESVSIGQALFTQERDLLTDGNPERAASLAVRGADFERVDRRMRAYLAPFNITKIKVFGKDTKIVYSTDHTIVGKMEIGNQKLDRALRGEVVAKMETKGKVTDLADEERFNVDVVETYLPVTNKNGQIIGSFEVYMDMTPSREHLSRMLRSSMTVIATILLTTFAVLFLIMRKGTIQLKKYENQLHTMAITDDLTGIANRRFVLDRAEEELSRVQRMTPSEKRLNSVGWIMIDIDFFKQVNDTYGHAAGDAVLKEMGVRLKRVARRYDIVGRYGGEEFLILAPHTHFEQTKILADRVWRAVREKPFAYEAQLLDITVSVGVACTDEEDASVAETIKRADDGLYKAKESGRDQIAWMKTQI
jgi:diguanylate cyclase (GGDEF)-like protein